MYFQARQAQAARLELALREVNLLRDRAQADPDGDPVKWERAVEALKRAGDLLSPLIGAESRRHVSELSGQVVSSSQAAERDAKLVRETVDIRSAEADDPDGSAVAAWKHLVATARAVDPDKTRDRLRQLWSEPDRKAQREPLLNLAKEADPHNWPPRSLTLLAAAVADAGERETAVELLRRAQAEHPGDFWVNYWLARNLEQLHPAPMEEAIRYYSVARALRPETAHELAHALEDQERGDQAVTIFRDLTRLRPENGRHWRCLGALLKVRGDRAGSEAALEQAVAALRFWLRKKPDDAGARDSLGLALSDQGKSGEAIAEFREAIRLKPDYAEAHCNVGLVLARQGNFSESLAELRRGHELGSKRPGWPFPSARWVARPNAGSDWRAGCRPYCAATRGRRMPPRRLHSLTSLVLLRSWALQSGCTLRPSSPTRNWRKTRRREIVTTPRAVRRWQARARATTSHRWRRS